MRIDRTARETRSRIERLLDAANSKGLPLWQEPRHVEDVEAAVAEGQAVQAPS